ncbi:hypothetical protein [Paraburkholderia atlantica]|uniref:hypothetical protein n=1 Tax=Paraburkholderia atlantica TaxID=2654982 RepID=UPI0012F8D3DB|nr:hypothetical protein [Paraburkholderia atlantica]
MIVVDLPAALWVEKKGYFWLFLGVSGFWLFFLSLFFALLAFPCCLIGLLALPLCGAAPTFFAAAKKVGKEDSSNRKLISGSPGLAGIVVHLESVPPHIPRS